MLVTITRTPTSIRVYQNGIEVAAHTDIEFYDHGDEYAVNIGTYRDANGRWFKGKIDDVRIYNRALSSDDITAAYDATKDSPDFFSQQAGETTNQPPDTPTNISPANEATGVKLNPDLTSSAYSDPDGDPHADTQWQVDDNADFSSPVWTRTAGSAETTTTINSANGTFTNELTGKTELDHNTTYYWQVRYSDNVAGWSDWSTSTSFTTAQPPETPNNALPTMGALNQKLTPTLTGSAFSDPDNENHEASQWLIRSLTDPTYDTPVYTSGIDTNNLTSITIPSGTLSKNTTYFWKVRYKNDKGAWSNYSSEAAFTTGVVPVTVIAVGATEYTEGETARLTVQVKDADGSPINNATSTITVFDPLGAKVVDDAAMTFLAGSNGLYRYNYTIPSTLGVYTYEVTAEFDGQTGYSAHTFHVSQAAKTIAEIKAITEAEQTAQTAERIAQETARGRIEDIQTRVTDIQNNLATLISEIGTGNIAAIKTKTDTINWMDITNIITTSGEIKAKTDTVAWTDITAIKTKTETINWTDVIGIDTKITNVQADITTLISEIGTGNITAIKTKIDTIDWMDITSIITTAGEIKAKTDTVAWTDILAIKTKTDTINWADVIGIDTKITNLQNDMDILVGAMIVTQGTVNDESPSATSFITSLTNSTDDFYKNAVLTFTSGNLNGQSRRISAYNGTTKTITLDPALTSAPANSDNFTIVKQNVRVEEQVIKIQEQVKAHEEAQATFRTNIIDRLTGLQTSIEDVYLLLETVDTELSTVQTTVNNIRTSQQKDHRVTLTDVSQIAVGTTYQARLSIENLEGNPTDPVSAPEIIIYDALGTTATSSEMTKISDGVYRFDYSVPSDGVTGLWETVVSVNIRGETKIVRNDLWQAVGSPAQVIINTMSDLEVPDIAADVTITNEGTTGFEYQYEWCVVSSQEELCGENTNVYYASAAKFIETGQNFNTVLTATVPEPGDYLFKAVVYFGIEQSGASRTFTAIEKKVEKEEVDPSSGGGTPILMPDVDTPSITPPTALTREDIYSELIKVRNQLDLNSQRLEKTLETLDIMNPRLQKVLTISDLNAQDLSGVQSKITELQAVSNTVRRIIKEQTLQPIVETYMEFGSIRINFLITNPADTPQPIDFKAFLPQEVKPEHIIDIDGLSIDYDISANTYFISGQINLQGKESITRKITIKDIWFFPNEEIRSIRTQTESILDFLKKTQYHAQGIILKNDIDDSLGALLARQEKGLASPEEKIIAYRENLQRIERAERNLEQLKKLMTQAETERGIVGRLGGIQTFSVWGIILAIMFCFGLLTAVIFAMWRHQTILVATTMGVSKKELARYFNGTKKQELKKPNKKQVTSDIQQISQRKRILTWLAITIVITGAILLTIKFIPISFNKQETSMTLPAIPQEETENPLIIPTTEQEYIQTIKD